MQASQASSTRPHLTLASPQADMYSSVSCFGATVDYTKVEESRFAVAACFFFRITLHFMPLKRAPYHKDLHLLLYYFSS